MTRKQKFLIRYRKRDVVHFRYVLDAALIKLASMACNLKVYVDMIFLFSNQLKIIVN